MRLSRDYAIHCCCQFQQGSNHPGSTLTVLLHALTSLSSSSAQGDTTSSALSYTAVHPVRRPKILEHFYLPVIPCRQYHLQHVPHTVTQTVMPHTPPSMPQNPSRMLITHCLCEPSQEPASDSQLCPLINRVKVTIALNRLLSRCPSAPGKQHVHQCVPAAAVRT